MRRPLFLSVNLFNTRAGLKRSIAVLVLETRALIALSALPSDDMMLLRYSKWLTLFNLFTEHIDGDISMVFGVDYNTVSFLDRYFYLSQSEGFCHLIQRLGSICLVVRDQSQIISLF